MNVEQKLVAIRDAIQQDVGNRGFARDPNDNLITAFPNDFANACRAIAQEERPLLGVVTGFYIPHATPPCGETDGPLGALFLAGALSPLGIGVVVATDPFCVSAVRAGLDAGGQTSLVVTLPFADDADLYAGYVDAFGDAGVPTHYVALERVGPSFHHGRCFTMSGRDITDQMRPGHLLFEEHLDPNWQWGPDDRVPSIGIGDGGNEIGMGKIPHETIVKNIPNSDLTHCRVPTDHLIVAGVSNWGAYALAAGVALLRGVQLPNELFDPDRERELLQVIVDAGPLVDGVTGKQTATVDGLTWDDYVRPLIEIGKIVKA